MRMIEQRGTTYRVVWRVGGRKQSVTAATYETARGVRGLIESKRRQITSAQVRAMLSAPPTTSAPTVAAWCERFVSSVTGVESLTRKEYERIVRDKVAGTKFGTGPLPEVNREKVRLWLLELEKSGLRPKTIANYHAVVSAAMTEAVAQELIGVNPCRGVRLPRRDDHTTLDEHIYLDPAEVRLIASALPQWCAYVPMLLADTGLRWGELTALQVGDVDVLGGTLRVGRAWKRQAEGGWKQGAPKSRMSRRTVVLGDDARDILATRTAGRRATEFVVTSVDGVSRLPRSTFMRHWTRALYGAGTMGKPDGGLVGSGQLEKHPHLHSLRHTHASWLISNGASPAFVQAQLGHEDISTTMRIYGHLMPATHEHIREALRRAKGSDVLPQVDDVPALGAGA
jgi:integrase